MNSKYKDKLVGVYAPGNYGHTSVLDQTQEFSRWFWSNREDMEIISIKLGIDIKKLNRMHVKTPFMFIADAMLEERGNG